MRSTRCLNYMMAVLLLAPISATFAGQPFPLTGPMLDAHLSSPKATTPTVTTWPTASAINYGQTLASSTLSGGAASVEGTFAFTDPTITPDAGTYAAGVTFTPTDTTNFTTVTGTVNVPVNPSSATNPTISVWPTASAITYGQKLSFSTLSGGTASVEGTFAFTDPNIVPPVGTYVADVTFTPTDTVHYNTVSGNVNVTVNSVPSGDYTWRDYVGIPLLMIGALGIVRLAEMDRVDGPCFIATAAWGTPLAPEIDRLREFRDNTLLTGAVGIASVDVYYHVSPAIADMVAVSPALATLVRMALIPVIVLVSLPTPLLATLTLLTGIPLLRNIVRRRKAGSEPVK